MKTRSKTNPKKQQIKAQSKQQPIKQRKKQRITKLQKPQQQVKQKSSQKKYKNQLNQPQKQKKIVKPKKYVKTYEQIARMERSKYQRIYLLTAERNEQQTWKFLVQGTSGSTYHVNISTIVQCTCVDFRMKKKPCKHIYFIVTQVAQNNQILDYFNSTTKISKIAYKVLDDQLLLRLKSRLAKKDENEEKVQKKQIDLKDDVDCTICFTQMDKVTQTLQDCPTCHKYFHFECLSAWKKHNPTCPLCRGDLKGKNIKKVQNDPLGLLQNINIESKKD